MTMTDTVAALLKEKKEQMGNAPSIKKVATAAAVAINPLVDVSMFPVPKNTITYEQIVGEPHPDGVVRNYPAFLGAWDYPEDVPEPNPKWVRDHKTLPILVAAVMYRKNALAVGEAGSGKTTDVREVAARVGIPYYRVNGVGGSEPSDFVGGSQLSDGENGSVTKWVDGVMVRPCLHGGLLHVDESSKNSPITNQIFQSVAEAKSTRCLFRYGHEDETQIRVPIHNEFMMVATDNVRGTGDNQDRYTATEVQDVSFLNRFCYKYRKDYMEPSAEVYMLTQNYPWVTTTLAELMVKFGNLIREGVRNGAIELVFSMRELEYWADGILEFEGDIMSALENTYGSLLTSGTEKDIYQKALLDVGLLDNIKRADSAGSTDSGPKLPF